jgi:hypothetical protein
MWHTLPRRHSILPFSRRSRPWEQSKSVSVVDLKLRMKEIANWALNVATMRGASYADARIVSQRSRALTTKNGKVGSASDAESWDERACAGRRRVGIRRF